MSQNRPPPAYQEYAASMIADQRFRAMSLAERGLLYTMRIECWVNHSLPRAPERLAKVLGLDMAEIEACLPAVLTFFTADREQIRSPDLESYREHLARIHQKKSEGGKKSAASRRSAKSNECLKTLQSVPEESPNSLVKPSSGKTSQDQSSESGYPCLDPEQHRWLQDFESAEPRVRPS